MSGELLVARGLVGDAALVALGARLGLGRLVRSPRRARGFAALVLSDPDGNELRFEKDHLLGQCLVRASGPRSRELVAAVAAELGEWTLEAALRAAREASAAAAKIAALGPLTTLVSTRTALVAQALPVFAERLGDDSVPVRRAALLALSYLADLPEARIGELLETALADPQLAVEARRQLRLRRPESTDGGGEPGDDMEAWMALAESRHAEGKRASALSAALATVALARRQGLRLRELQRQVNELRATVDAGAAASEDEALVVIADLATLLRSGRSHEAEEVAELMQPGARRELVAALNLVIGVARLLRQRAERAIEALGQALAAAPWVESAYLLGRCHELLGQPEEAAAAFAMALADETKPATVAAARLGERTTALLELVLDRPPGPPSRLSTSAWFDGRELSFRLAALLVELGRPEEALRRIGIVLASDPAADAWLASATVHNLLGRPQAALSDLERAEATLSVRERLVDDEDPRAAIAYQRALACAALADPAAALSAAVTAVASEPAEIERVSSAPSLAEALALPEARTRLAAAGERGKRARAFFTAARQALHALGSHSDPVEVAAKTALVELCGELVPALEAEHPSPADRERGAALSAELAMLAALEHGAPGPAGGADFQAALLALRAALSAVGMLPRPAG